MLDINKWSQYGKDGLEPTCITIHNTGNYDMTARELFDYLNNECLTSQGCHFLIDDKEIIEVMPLNWKTYHTGKGEDYAFNNSIAIEICSNLDDELYLKGQENAIRLIKNYMDKFDIPKEELYFHIDFNPTTYCPCNILDLYKTKENFLNKFF
ncbi:MAG: peptidoglycan recognition protein family protein [Solobacterium sp.]|nr:peptidoglycan recognition protein family protein [Solobacterium sp.]MDY2606660.1 peptidoglycan recognition family protein [Lachnospiraceae bacterium]